MANIAVFSLPPHHSLLEWQGLMSGLGGKGSSESKREHTYQQGPVLLNTTLGDATVCKNPVFAILATAAPTFVHS